MKIRSNDFEHGGKLPIDCTCDGLGRIPNLLISDLPESAKSIALIIEDPDAPSGTFIHFLAWNIPTDPEAEEIDLDNFSVTGKTSSGGTEYVPPCPPSGEHRYFFKVYALSEMIDLPNGSSRDELEKIIQNHLMEEAQMLGIYTRS